MSDYEGHQALEGWRNAYVGGDQRALLDSVEWCAVHKVVMPGWVARAYCSAMDKAFRDHSVDSLDEAFGFDEGEIKYWRKAWRETKIVSRVYRYREQGEPIDEAFRKTADDENCGESNVGRIWYKRSKSGSTRADRTLVIQADGSAIVASSIGVRSRHS